MNMQPQRGTTTEHLADIIEILRIGNKSGTLMVERGEGRAREEGSIIFIAGQAVEARVNQQSGSAAFNYLSTWQRCHFSFVSQANAGRSTAPLPKFPLDGRGNPTNNRAVSGTDPAQPTSAQRLQNGRNTPREIMRSSAPQRLFRAEEALQRAESIQLARVHRRLLLLIDGKRSVDELARLVTRDTSEVQKFLGDLERAGLIRQ